MTVVTDRYSMKLILKFDECGIQELLWTRAYIEIMGNTNLSVGENFLYFSGKLIEISVKRMKI